MQTLHTVDRVRDRDRSAAFCAKVGVREIGRQVDDLGAALADPAGKGVVFAAPELPAGITRAGVA